MKYTLLLSLLLCLSFKIHSQELINPPNQPSICESYDIDGNIVTFNCENGSKVQLKFMSPSMVRFWYAPDGKLSRNNESFAVINEDIAEVGKIQVNEQQALFEIFTGVVRIRVDKNPFRVQIFDQYQKLIMGDFEDRGFVSEGNYKGAFKQLRSDEQFFGLGEKAGPLNKRGRTYKMWNSDIPCYSAEQDPLYKSIPFFMSSYRYGIFFDNTYKTAFDFGSASEKYYSFETPDGPMIYYFIYDKDYKGIIQQYTQLTGQPIMPPKWAFGFSQSRGLYKYEEQALEVANEFRKRQIPNDIIYQDIGWTQYLQDFEWKKENYNDPKGMLEKLAADGFKMIVSQDPVISQANKKQWKEADELGYLVLDKRTGESYDMPWPWGGNAGVVDFTKPEVADWWGEYQQKPLDDGVKGFWTDMGEPAWSNEEESDRLHMQHQLGMHDEIHNVYGLTWDKVVKEQFEKRNPNQRIFQMTRAAYAGLQRYTFGWSGDAGNGLDVLEGWDNLANQVPLSLSSGMGLIPFWATDISGYCGEILDYPALTELYIRWLQFGVMNPLSRAHHEGDNAVEPWLFGEEAEEIAKSTIELKYQLFPYIYSYAREAYDTGIPLLRATFLEYPNDPKAIETDHQYFFGEELLVAPVVEQGAMEKEVYLPEGEWIDFYDKKTSYKGKQKITVDAPLNKIPVFVKKGSILPMMPVMQYIHEDPHHPIIFEIFPATLGKQASFELYEDDGESNNYQQDKFAKTLITSLSKKDNYIINLNREIKDFEIPKDRNLLLKVYLDEKPKTVTLNGEKLKSKKPEKLTDDLSDTNVTLWSWDKEKGVCYVKLADTGEKQEVRINK